ncbi:MAG: RsmD family RNA methyltransferase [Bacteroidia bacterium]|nr:RsmD family RNA methyltransferase [Bacteroidia bacterium]
MRIIGGNFKGRTILAPGSLPVRPTTDYAKSGIFNILNNHFDFEAITVLDLFCGTGNISFEFASRGAIKVTGVDSHSACLKFINEFSLKIGAKQIQTVRSDVFSFLKQNANQYDIIFADPPFELKDTDSIPDLVFAGSLLKPEGWLIIEHQSKRKLSSNKQPAQVREYGNCAFSIYREDTIESA